jgi:RNA polymerase sigma factor (sigma-70 family)
MPDAPLTELVTRLRDLAAEPGDGVADADLLRRYVEERDAVAFEALVWRHARLVMGVCRRTLRHHQDAEDAFQATFLLLARKAHRIRRGALLPAWLHTTAVRVARRARSRRRPLLVADLPEQPTTDPLPEYVEAGAILDAEVRRLPARLRAAFVLCGLEGRSHADAARELGCPKGTIDSRIAAAKCRLQSALTRLGLTLAPVAALVAAVPELAYSEAARKAAVLGLNRRAEVSPAVAALLAPAGRSRWLVGLAAALALVAAGTIATVSSMAGTGDPPKPPADRPGDGPKTAENSPAGERRVPGMKPLFKRTTIGIPESAIREVIEPHRAYIEELYAGVIQDRRKAGKPFIPPTVPCGDGNHFIYFADGFLVCASLVDDKVFDEFVRRGEYVWGQQTDTWTEFGTDRYFKEWADSQGTGRVELLLHRTLSCAFVTAGKQVQYIDDLTILPTAKLSSTLDSIPANLRFPERGLVIKKVTANSLKIIDTESGKLLLKVDRSAGFDKPFGGSLYLGPPLPSGDLAFLIHENDKRVRLTCVSWDRIKKAEKPPWPEGTLRAANETLLWDTELAMATSSVVADPHRRIHAIHLAKAGDVIISPTHLGRVVAVEAKTGKVKWTHEYAPLDGKRFPTFAPEWFVVPPVVAGEKYIYAPADFPELLCLNVADGKKVWSIKKGDGLYPAVVGDQVLVIGEKTVRSLSLKDGSEQWKLDLPGLPCGRGAALGEAYLVPVSEPKTWRGMIAIVDLKSRKIAEVLKPEKDEPIGNLVVHQDFLISQTLTEIAVFPIKKKE